MWIKVLWAVAGLLLAGPLTAQTIPMPQGMERSHYYPGPQVGHLYFAKRPARSSARFETIDDVPYFKMCTNDFRKTKALVDVTTNHVERELWRRSIERRVTASGRLDIEFKALVRLLNIGAGGDYRFDLDTGNVVTERLTEDGASVIAEALGRKCRDDITRYRELGGEVVLVTERLVVSELVVGTSRRVEGEARGGWFNFGGSGSASWSSYDYDELGSKVTGVFLDREFLSQ